MRTGSGNSSQGQLEAAIPFVFNGTVGHFMPASAAVSPCLAAVLFLNPWGFEEMSTRRFYRALAEQLAALGIPSLRFDYPGTGDALDDVDFSDGLKVWETSVHDAAAQLWQKTGFQNLVVIGQGLGALIAMNVSKDLPALHSVVLINPPSSGKLHLRELALWSTTIDNNLELRPEHRDHTPGSIAGFAMPPEIANDVRNFNVKDLAEYPQGRVLLAGPERGFDAVSTILKEKCASLELLAFNEYPQMIANVTISKVPHHIVSNIADWIRSGDYTYRSSLVVPIGHSFGGKLTGPGFVEVPVRFGPDNQFSGMLCAPAAGATKTAVLFFTTAYERHASWGRQHLQLARQLAASGIMSLRFDTAAVGDSPARPGAKEQVLYSDDQQFDCRQAVNFLSEQGVERIVAVGRCSGAFLAFQTAVQDSRIKGLVTLNPGIFYWPKGKSVDASLQFVPRALTSYIPKLFSMTTIRRLKKGEINIGAALRNTAEVIQRKLTTALESVVVLNHEQWTIRQKCRQAFGLLAARDVPFALSFSEGDVGIPSFFDMFGRDAAMMRRYQNIDLRFIADCDHNLTPPHSRAHYYSAIVSTVEKVEKTAEAAADRRSLKTRVATSAT